MFLSAVLFVLFLAGCWLYCLTDAALTPAAEFPGLRKPVWIAVIAVTFILGAIAWYIARKLWRIRYWPASPAGPADAGSGAAPARPYPDHPKTAPSGYRVAEALTRHPASRSKNAPRRTAPIGPDDDPEFLASLGRAQREQNRLLTRQEEARRRREEQQRRDRSDPTDLG